MIKNAHLTQQLAYFRQFFCAPRTFGTLVPSSPWLCQRMVNQADWPHALRVAELGAATGVLTRRILRHMRADARLDAYEIAPDFVRILEKNADTRLNVVAQSAEHLRCRYDVIFSCLPLLSIPAPVSVRILRQARASLNPGGVMIQFQYSPMSEKLLSRYFEWEKVYEMRNFPPAWVYICTPRDDERQKVA